MAEEVWLMEVWRRRRCG
ncbi:hypothetical protein LINPERHAP2_LOCUS11038 [Linum perenne]